MYPSLNPDWLPPKPAGNCSASLVAIPLWCGNDNDTVDRLDLLIAIAFFLVRNSATPSQCSWLISDYLIALNVVSDQCLNTCIVELYSQYQILYPGKGNCVCNIMWIIDVWPLRNVVGKFWLHHPVYWPKSILSVLKPTLVVELWAFCLPVGHEYSIWLSTVSIAFR